MTELSDRKIDEIKEFYAGMLIELVILYEKHAINYGTVLDEIEKIVRDIIVDTKKTVEKS